MIYKTSAIALMLLITGCYAHRPSSGGGQTDPVSRRNIRPADVAVPDGYEVSLVAQGLTFPTGIAFDDTGAVYVTESGYCYGEKWTTPRLLRIESPDRAVTVAAGSDNGPWNGVAFHNGEFFIAEGGVLHGGRILRVTRDGQINPIVSNLPSFGDHHTNGPAIGPDGNIYFGQGTATNSAVVGEDNAKFGWLKRKPQFHDIPGRDIRLTGENFKTNNVLTGSGSVQTGAFLPFGQRSQPGQIIQGALPCTGAIMRVAPDGSGLALVAWGMRNPFGLAFTPQGKLFVTDNGYDDRGSRPVWGTPDLLWSVEEGLWYGWPDFSGDEPLTREAFEPPGKEPVKFVLAEHPNKPPRPIARLGVHAAATGLDIARGGAFGHDGDAFIALFGDQAPDVGKVLHPVGFKVIRVSLRDGVVHDFAVNRGDENGPASYIGGGGLERPIAVKFSPDGRSLYVVDFGVLRMDNGSKPQTGTGAVWKITRTNRTGGQP